jgi:hypothetical protein
MPTVVLDEHALGDERKVSVGDCGAELVHDWHIDLRFGEARAHEQKAQHCLASGIGVWPDQLECLDKTAMARAAGTLRDNRPHLVDSRKRRDTPK